MYRAVTITTENESAAHASPGFALLNCKVTVQQGLVPRVLAGLDLIRTVPVILNEFLCS